MANACQIRRLPMRFGLDVRKMVVPLGAFGSD